MVFVKYRTVSKHPAHSCEVVGCWSPSLPFFSTLACVLGGIKSQASVKGLTPWLLLCFTCSFTFPDHLSVSQPSHTDCIILFSISEGPVRADNAKEWMCHLQQFVSTIYKEMWNQVFFSVECWLLSFDIMTSVLQHHIWHTQRHSLYCSHHSPEVIVQWYY